MISAVNCVSGPLGTTFKYAVLSHYINCVTDHLHLRPDCALSFLALKKGNLEATVLPYL